MGVLTYTLMTYGLTVAISFAVVGIIVLVNKAVSAAGGEEKSDE